MDKTIETPEDALRGRRVLVMLPPAAKDRTKYILMLLEEAKASWRWQVSALCPKTDRKALEPLTIQGGHLFFSPHQLRTETWERDEAQVAATEKLIREAEVAVGLPLGRIVLGGAHTVGRAFNTPVRRAPRYTIVRRVLKDNAEPHRIVRRMFHFADDMLEAADPELILAFEWATALNSIVWLAAQRRGIPSVAIRYSKINADHAFWTSDRLMYNTEAIARGKAKREAGAAISEAAKTYIQTFREQPVVIKYIAQKWGNRTQRGFLRWHLQYARVVVREFINTIYGQDRSLREPALARFYRYYRGLFMSYWHHRFLKTFDDAELAGMKYIYFPMHKEAELAQTFQATQWYDQRNTVRVLASMLPFGYRLLVREHRLNHGQRPTRFFREMSKIPNVTLIDPFDSQFKYLHHADLVVTENGSSGWEGLLLRRRVLLLAQTFYAGAGLGVSMADPERLNATILEMLAKTPVTNVEAYDHALGCMIDGELETTFPMTTTGKDVALKMLSQRIRGFFAIHAT